MSGCAQVRPLFSMDLIRSCEIRIGKPEVRAFEEPICSLDPYLEVTRGTVDSYRAAIVAMIGAEE